MTLYLLHGWGLNRRVFAPLEAALPFAVSSLDLPGHGGAPYAPGALDPAALAAALVAAHPGRHAWLGWSLGGLVALTLAATYPDAVSHLILVAATPCFTQRPDWPFGVSDSVFTGFAADLTCDPSATVARFLALQAGPRGRDQIRALTADIRTGGAASPAALAEGLAVLRTTDLRPQVSALLVPTLVLHGAGDTIVPDGASRWLAAHVPQARRVEAGRGHAPFLSAADTCTQAIREFLRD